MAINLAIAVGQPFSKVLTGKQSINGHRVQVKQEYLTNAIQSLAELVSHL